LSQFIVGGILSINLYDLLEIIRQVFLQFRISVKQYGTSMNKNGKSDENNGV